jgi:uncharacterized protein (DUF2267 family)
MAMDFNKYAAKGNELLNKLAVRLGDEHNRDHAARVLRSTLHVLRDHTTIEESIQLIAQLPMMLKGIYVDGWKPGSIPRIRTLEDFAAEIIGKDGNAAWRDFSNKEEVLRDVRMVIETLAEYVSTGELEDVFSVMPKELKKTFTSWLPQPAIETRISQNGVNDKRRI